MLFKCFWFSWLQVPNTTRPVWDGRLCAASLVCAAELNSKWANRACPFWNVKSTVSLYTHVTIYGRCAVLFPNVKLKHFFIFWWLSFLCVGYITHFKRHAIQATIVWSIISTNTPQSHAQFFFYYLVFCYLNSFFWMFLYGGGGCRSAAPNFVSSFAHGDYVYFTFREPAVEYMNCGKVSHFFIFTIRIVIWFWILNISNQTVYSRIARVCKSDRGGPHKFRYRWTSLCGL
jgi:hypothetical protein